MALPIIATPTFELIQPSTGETLKFRPFLVKEEKVLLIAKESTDKKDMFNAIKQIINNCVLEDDFDVDSIPLFDMEYIFINIRSKSISNVVEFQVEDSDDGITYDLSLNLDEVEVLFDDEHTNKIKMDDNNGIVMKYPTPEISGKIMELESLSQINFETVKNCIETVYDADEVYQWNQYSDEEQNEYLDALAVGTFERLQEFFVSMPHIEHIVKYTNSNGKEKVVIFRDLDDFFSLY